MCRAVALYKGDWERAEELLQRAANESSMVEPHILLSQVWPAAPLYPRPLPRHAVAL